MTEYAGETRRDSKRMMVGVLAVLIVAILSLGVGIFLVSQRDMEQNEETGSGLSALEISNEIVARFGEDAEYTLADAYGEYEKAIEDSDDEQGLFLTIYYANFIYAQTGEIELAIDVLNQIEPSLNEEMKMNYYLAFKNLYNMAGDIERVEEYQQKINELMPMDERAADEIMEVEEDE